MKVGKKHIEFSKIIMLVAMTINIIVIAFSFVMMWITLDTTPLCYLIPAVAGEVATGSAFYYNKAKAENEIKIKMQYEERAICNNEER